MQRDLCPQLVLTYLDPVIRGRKIWTRATLLGLAAAVSALLASTAPARPPGRLDWRPAENKVTADINGWPLDRLLETIAARTRWHVFVDPQARHVVNAKFSDLAPGEALRRLLGSLNFVLVPASNAAPTLYVFSTSRQAATTRIAVPPTEERRSHRLKDELIVTLKPGSDAKIEDLAAKLGAKIIGRSDALGAYRLKFAAAAAAEAARAQLMGTDGTSRVDANYLVDRPPSGEALLPAGGVGLGIDPKPVAPGEGVVVAVVDTAVQGDAAGIKDFLLPAISVAGAATPPADELAHGTSMAETLVRTLAAAPDASSGSAVRILPVDVYGNNSSATSFDVALGIQAAINSGAPIVNLSLGGPDESPFVHNLIQAGHDKGVVFLAAAGNEPVTSPTFPAADPEVIAVTAVNRSGNIASYANYGNFVDVGAPGTSYVTFWGQPYMVVGTSPATASASAMAASIAAATGKRGADLEAAIRQNLAVSPAELAP